MYDNKIKESIDEIKDKFYKIKKIPFHKSLRKGSTGIGYTFEKLMGKKEDSSYEPDYKGIELKTKLGYSKSPLTLFGLVGQRCNGDSIYRYLIDNYGYFRTDKKNNKRLSGEVYANTFKKMKNGFLWKLKIDLNENKIKLLILDRYFCIVDESVYWNFDDIKERLLTKLNYMALVKGYPYNYNNELYYKYTNLYFYKLKGFNEFLKMVEQGNIFVCINISYDFDNNEKKLTDRNISFRLNINCINELFYRIW